MKTIKDFDFKDKKALVRVDFNVPQSADLKVTDNTRIQAVKPTVDKILNDGGSVILMTHLGRPKGKVSEEFSLKNIVPEIETVFMMTSSEYSFVSSSGIKELAQFGGDISKLVPPMLYDEITQRCRELAARKTL